MPSAAWTITLGSLRVWWSTRRIGRHGTRHRHVFRTSSACPRPSRSPLTRSPRRAARRIDAKLFPFASEVGCRVLWPQQSARQRPSVSPNYRETPDRQCILANRRLKFLAPSLRGALKVAPAPDGTRWYLRAALTPNLDRFARRGGCGCAGLFPGCAA